MTDYQKRKNPRLQGYDYNAPGAYFLTLCTENRRCLLARIVGTGVLDGPQIVLSPYGKIAEKYIRQLQAFYTHLSVEAYVIMPNHIHLLLLVKENGPSGTPVPTSLSAASHTAQNAAIPRFVSTLKRFCNKEYGQNIWQARFYDHIIRNQADFRQHLQYIQENPLKWEMDKLYVTE